jgi:predicted RNase H-like nuclease (RuvC/YqgF family)
MMAATEAPESEEKPTVEELTARLDALSTQLDTVREELTEEREERRSLEAALEERDDRIADLETRLEELDARTDLLNVIDDVDQMDGKQRSVTLIQHLKRKAETQRDRDTDESARASVNREEAEDALHHPDVDRTTIYDDMRRAVRLVGDEDVLWYDSGGGTESRLRLDLESGSLPGAVAGQRNQGGQR